MIDPDDSWMIVDLDNKRRKRCYEGFSTSDVDPAGWCDRPAHSGDLCRKHTNIEAGGRDNGKRPSGCIIDLGSAQCGTTVLAKGMCAKHYRRAQRGATLVAAHERIDIKKEASDGTSE